ncbi:MAG: hypothetical protein LBF97_00735 [Elusimicrobiota bacterium]|jgi:hypothetical protein|nr:hypothetical protein [Elusimicrobiota bacterium]
MSKRLGTPYKTGKSEVINNYLRSGNAEIVEGLFVALQADGTIKKVNDEADIPKGITGMFELKGQSVVQSGLEVYAQLASGATAVIGARAFVDATTGQLTSVETDNIPINAIFASEAVECIDSKNNIYQGAAIDFVGGL